MSTLNFLWEIGVEEIPSRYLAELTLELKRRMTDALNQARLWSGPLDAMATPRRLVMRGRIRSHQEPKLTVMRGPRLQSAYHDQVATAALEGFLRRAGVSESDLVQETVDGKIYLVATLHGAQDPARVILPGVAEEAFLAMVLPRSMRWGSGSDRFVRPIRWTGLWLEDEVLPLVLAGVSSGHLSYGNRTDHPQAVTITSVEAYWTAIRSPLGVMLDASERRRVIVDEGRALALEVGGAMDEDRDLVDEVQALVEWPVPFRGAFDPQFLSIPEPILATAMKVHQRYFPVTNPQGGLLPFFIGVRNGEGLDLDAVRHGNEKVLRARLQDADYFYHQDIQTPLANRGSRLAGVVFHAKLGTYEDKVERLLRLWSETQDLWSLSPVEAEAMRPTLELLKCDLVTHVVEEFPELEGVMGGIYAKHDGHSDLIAEAIGDQYLPRWQGDPIPRSRVGAVVGLLDRIDTLVMAWAHGIQPTGSEDPFGLRRTALGIARIGTESNAAPNLGLTELLQSAKQAYALEALDVSGPRDLVVSRLKSFWEDRALAEAVDALLAGDDALGSLGSRIAQWRQVAADEAWSAYLAGFKRVDRVLKGWTQDNVQPAYLVPAEDRLAKALAEVGQAAGQGFHPWWHALPEFLSAITSLFDEVLVMDPDPTVRGQRLSLLAACRRELSRYWDPSRFSASEISKGRSDERRADE